MKYIEITENLLEGDTDFIVHQVNCQSIMGSGIALQIRNRWPVVYTEYLYFCSKYKPNELLGKMLPVWTNDKFEKCIVNVFSQLGFGYDGKRYTSYDAMVNGLDDFKKYLKDLYVTLDRPIKIGFPKNMGAFRGGGNWNIIETIIKETFSDTDYEIYIYNFDKK